MNLTTKDLLKHSFVITIDDKKFEWFKKVFKFHGLSPTPKRLDGVTYWYNSPQYNCYLAHKNAILTAKKKKWPYVCVFEDDAYPINGVMETLDAYLKELPDDCKVLSLGQIFMWEVMGEYRIFWRSFCSYGAHAYVVFKDAYDSYVEMLDKFPEGDGAFYSRNEGILPKESFFIPKRNLFIQYSNSGMNNHDGYIWLHSSRLTRGEDGHWKVPYDKSIPEDMAMKMGFPKFETIRTTKVAQPAIKNSDDPLVFVTVNAGTNDFTNVTVKSIFNFHPNAKVFVVDVKPESKFTLMDGGPKGDVEVIEGISEDKLNLPTVKVTESTGLTIEEQLSIVHTFHESNEIEVLPCGDFQHPINIQFAIDNIQQNFVLIDSDAPLIAPIEGDFVDRSVITTSEVESWNYVHLDRLHPLIRPESPRLRFCPYIQFLNVDMMKEHGLRYFNANTLKDNLDISGWFKNPGYDGKETLFFWTGALFHRNVTKMGLPYKDVFSVNHIDHFGGATWQDRSDRHERFVEKYSWLLK